MFIPSKHGWHFDNDFPEEPIFTINVPDIGSINIGNAGNGLCGGIVYLALDYYHNYESIPDIKQPPTSNTLLFKDIVKRLIDSFDLPFGIIRYYNWMASSESLFDLTMSEIQNINLLPTPIGIIRYHSVNPIDLKNNHQVIIYETQSLEHIVTAKIYDPNYADDDNVALTIDKVSRKIMHNCDGEIRGFFITKYNILALDF